MSDMPLISKKGAYGYLGIAREEGLKNVRIGNIHLLVYRIRISNKIESPDKLSID